MARCRSCDAPIVWAETQATKEKPGRMIPLDAETDGRTLLVVERGNLTLTGLWKADGVPIVRYTKPGTGHYVTHFATCPNATQHRRK